MAVLATTDITLPKTIADGMFSKVLTGSAVAALSGSEPMQFGDVDIMTFTRQPRAEYVGEGSQKAADEVGFGSKTVKPHKVQVTLRFNEEVQWADEDHQLGVLNTLGTAGGTALARALDLGVIHRANPIDGSAVTSIPVGDVVGLTVNSTSTTSAPDVDFEAAVGQVITDGYVPSGVAFDPAFAFDLATQRGTGNNVDIRLHPELGFGQDITSFQGLRAASSSTVSGQPELTDTGIRAVVGDWSLLRWGVQRQIPVEMIRFGDPDGQGDLKRNNQIALRLEIVYGWAVMDLDGFALVEDGS